MVFRPRTDLDYREQAAKVYEGLHVKRGEAMQLQGEYGKWLVATIAVVHLGAIALLQSATLPNQHEKIIPFFILVGGLVAIIATGFTAYINWSLIAKACDDYADYRMLSDDQYWPLKPDKFPWITVTFWLAIILGITSTLCLPVAAYYTVY